MSQNVPLNYGDPALEPFFDSVQEQLSGGAPSLHLTVIADNTIRAPAGADDDQQSLAVAGFYRHIATNAGGVGQAAHPVGAAGTYDVYATASNNDFSGIGAGLDLTNYAFALEIRASGSPPTLPDIYRKVGETVWDGTKITSLIQKAGARYDDAPVTPTAPWPTVIPLRVRGVASQTAPLVLVENSAGTDLFTIAANGDLIFGGALTANTTLSVVGATTLASLSVTGTATLNGALDHNGTAVGFYGATPVARSTGWAVTNVTTDKTYDANVSTVDELADVLGTLINDLKSTGLLGA